MKIVSKLLFSIGAFLLLVNIYGLFKEIRPSDIREDHLRFKGDAHPVVYDGKYNISPEKMKLNLTISTG